MNSARLLFPEEPAARQLFPEGERIADDTVSTLRGPPCAPKPVGGQVLTVFTPAPGSPEDDAIRVLASWTARATTSWAPADPGARARPDPAG